jgi:hypothetical protein
MRKTCPICGRKYSGYLCGCYYHHPITINLLNT